MRIPRALMVSGLATVLAAGGGCASGTMEATFVAVTVSKLVRTETGMGYDTLVVKDEPSVKELASFFPGLTRDRTSNTAGAWYPTLRLTFDCGSGKTILVLTDYTRWNKGGKSGDFEVRGDLRAYIERLFAEQTTRPASPE